MTWSLIGLEWARPIRLLLWPETERGAVCGTLGWNKCCPDGISLWPNFRFMLFSCSNTSPCNSTKIILSSQMNRDKTNYNADFSQIFFDCIPVTFLGSPRMQKSLPGGLSRHKSSKRGQGTLIRTCSAWSLDSHGFSFSSMIDNFKMTFLFNQFVDSPCLLASGIQFCWWKTQRNWSRVGSTF